MADSKVNEILEMINQDANVADAPPTEISEAEIEAELGGISEKNIESRLRYSNQTDVVKLCAKQPHVGKYLREVLNTTQAECTTSGEFEGQMHDIFIPEKPRAQYDGFILIMPNGEKKIIKKSDTINFILQNCLLKITGGADEGRGLEVAFRNKKNKATGMQESVPYLKVYGLYAHREDDLEITYEPLKDESGQPLTKQVSVQLDKTYIDTDSAVGGGKPREKKLRGVVRDKYPVWTRKREYLDALGDIKDKGFKGIKKVEGADAINEALRATVKHVLSKGFSMKKD